ncbi:unnamed protein product, partial [Rotaria sp. Silwood2]
MNTQSTKIIKTKPTSSLTNKCSFDDDYDEATEDDFRMENQIYIDCEDNDEDDEDESELEFINENEL